MKITLEISGTQEKQLSEAAKKLNVRPEELALAAVTDLLSQADSDFREAAKRVLEKNLELYRRLS